MTLNKSFKFGMLALLVISVILLVYGFIAGFETNGGVPVDMLLYWAYVMLGLAVGCIVLVGLLLRVKNNPQGLVKMGAGLAAMAILALVSYLLAQGKPAMGMLVQPDKSTLKLTDTLLTLTYICGAGAVLAIIVGEVRMAISNKK